jgi:flagellin
MPVINTNTTANSALLYLSSNSSAQSESVSKIASGSRITKASDDAAGLAVSTSLQSDITVLTQASSNASNATSILQEADGTMSNIADMLQRMRSLATESLSGTVTNTERSYLDAEFKQLYTEINAISSGTRFNDVSLLDASSGSGWSETASGTAVGVNIRVGVMDTDVINIKIKATTTSAMSMADGMAVDSSAGATSALAMLNSAVDYLSDARSQIGAQISRFDYRNQTIQTSIENTTAAKSNITDVDVASEQTNLATEKVKTQAAIAVLSQANSMPSDLLSLLR